MTTYIDFSCQNIIVNVEKDNFFILTYRYFYFHPHYFSSTDFWFRGNVWVENLLGKLFYPEILCILEKVFHYELHKGLEHCRPLWFKIQKNVQMFVECSKYFYWHFFPTFNPLYVLWNIIKVRTFKKRMKN